MLKPDVIIAMGRDVVSALFGRGTTLGAVRGDVTRRFEGIPVISTVHAYALSLDPALLEAELAAAARRGRLPRCVVSVDLYGQPADIAALGVTLDYQDA